MSLTDGFKDALSCWCSGVSVVTTRGNGGLMYGLTVSSFSSLSLDPPLILVCIDSRNRFKDMVRESAGFAVSILDARQRDASNYFARPGRSPSTDFTEIDGDWTASGQPVVKDSMAWLACALHESIEVGDHTIVIGRVVETWSSEGTPLLYFKRGYRTLAP